MIHDLIPLMPSLSYPHANNRAIYHFMQESDDEFEISVSANEDFYALMVNLCDASDTYSLSGKRSTIPAGYFNLFYIPKDSLRWVFKQGVNSCLVIRCPRACLDSFRGQFDLIDEFLTGDNEKPRMLNRKAHVLMPTMEDEIKDIIVGSDFEGTLLAMWLRAKAGSLLFKAIDASKLHYLHKLDDACVLELQRVYTYMLENLEAVYHSDQLVAMSSLPEEAFHKLFDMIYQKSVDEALHQERLVMAEMLVRFSQKPVYEIAGVVGFRSMGVFVDAFEVRFGMQPGEFRSLYGAQSGTGFVK